MSSLSASPQILDPLKLPGALAPTGGFQTVTFIAAANKAYLSRFVVPRQMVITKIGFAVTNAATNNDECDVGIYNAALERLGSSGAKAALLNAGVAVQRPALTASVTLQPNTVYFAAFAYGAVGGTAASIGGVADNNGICLDLFSSEVITSRILITALTAFPLPVGPLTPTAAATPSAFLALIE